MHTYYMKNQSYSREGRIKRNSFKHLLAHHLEGMSMSLYRFMRKLKWNVLYPQNLYAMTTRVD